MSSIDRLVKLIPPPKKPVEVGGKKDWAQQVKQLGAKLPSDYKAFIDRYGSGEFAHFFIVYNPFSETVNLLEKFKSHGKNYAESHDSDPENYPLAVFPEVPGILPWGHDTNGHTYFWLVKDKKKPDEWTVVWGRGGRSRLSRNTTSRSANICWASSRAKLTRWPGTIRMMTASSSSL